MRRWIDVAFAAAIAALVWVLYRKVTRLWLTYDDAWTLHLAATHTFRELFTSPDVWPQKLYTPLDKVAYKLQLAWFGLKTERWFTMHLCLAFAAATSIYAAARCWFRPLESFVGAALWVAAVPLCSQTTELGSTHYFQAVVFAGIATALYVRALRAQRFGLALASAALYLLAMFAKETVVPLMVLLLILPERDFRTRARWAAGHAVALIAYLAARYHAIGTLLGGQGWAVEWSEWPSLIVALPRKLILAMAGEGLVIGALLLVVIAIGIAASLRGRHAVALFIIALLLAVGPIIPVSKQMEQRYAMMPWLCLSIAFVAGVATLRRRSGAMRATAGVLLVAAPALAAIANRQEWGYEFARAKRMSDEGRVLFDLPPNGLLRAPIIPPAAIRELNWVKCVYARREGGAGWFYDDLFLCIHGAAGKRMWQYDARSREVREVTPSIPVIAQRSCSAIRPTAPLAATFRARNGTLFWDLGPYDRGSWRVLIGDGEGAFDVPRHDGFRLPGVDAMALRIGYRSPAGWVTYSPEIMVDFRRPVTSWHR